MNTPNNIRAIRDSKGLKQGFVARKAGVCHSYFSQLENGHKSLKKTKYSYLQRIAGALGVQVEDLFPESEKESFNVHE